MFQAIFLLIIGSILTVFTASGIIHVYCCQLMSRFDSLDISQQWHMWIIPEAVNTVKMLLMMGKILLETC